MNGLLPLMFCDYLSCLFQVDGLLPLMFCDYLSVPGGRSATYDVVCLHLNGERMSDDLASHGRVFQTDGAENEKDSKHINFVTKRLRAYIQNAEN